MNVFSSSDDSDDDPSYIPNSSKSAAAKDQRSQKLHQQVVAHKKTKTQEQFAQSSKSFQL
jgi:hypothetical protein